MHERSIFPLLRLFLSFEMNFSIPRPRSDYISRGSEQPLVCDVIINFIYPTSKALTQLIMHLGTLNAG